MEPCNLLQFVPGTSEKKLAATVRWALVAVLLLALGWVELHTRAWPVVGDAAVMHYVNLLIDHGLQPYAQITDNNMPGVYLTERWAMALFGHSDVGWRLYDAALLAVMGASAVVLVGRSRWVAAVFATGLFGIMHVAAGPMFAAEREQLATTLVILSFACVAVGVRRHSSWMWALAGFATGLAGTVKPTFLPAGALAFCWIALDLRPARDALARGAACGIAGMAAAGSVVLLWLAQWKAVGAWWFVSRQITPAYVRMAHAPWSVMVEHALAPGSAVLAAVGVGLWWLARNKKGDIETWRSGLLLLGAAVGLASYWAQGKGFLHHRYTLELFVLLLVGVEVDRALRSPGLQTRVRTGRWIAVATAILVCVGIVPHYLHALDRVPSHDALLDAMVGDLESATGAPGQIGVAAERLDRNVMCLDLVYGCLAALNRMGVQETAGFTGDLMLWEPLPSTPRAFYRKWFQQVMRDDRPEFLVLSNEWFGRPNSFNKVRNWPRFAQELAQHYTMVAEKRFPTEYGPAVPRTEAPGYRIYKRRDCSPATLPSRAE